ncbi:MAG: hypothetical protein WA151_13735 [Desulfatirhabdiaceae bacterium]
MPLELRDYSGQTPKKYPLTLLMTDLFLKVDVSILMSIGEKAELLYRIPENRIYYILHHLRYYIVIDEQSTAGLSGNLNQLTAFLDQQLGTRLSRAPSVNYRVESLNGEKTIGNMTCKGRSVWHDNTKIQEIWSTPWNKAGLQPVDLKPLQQLLNIADRVRSDLEPILPLGEWANLPIRYILTPDGYPVLVQQFNASSVRLEAHFGKPKPNSLASKDFQIPPQYEKKDLIPYLLETGFME